MNKYESYKEVELSWLKEIPSHWKINRVRDNFKVSRGRVISKELLKENGKFPVYSSQTMNSGILGYIDTYDFNGERITWTTDGANAGTVFYRNGFFSCTNICGILENKNEKSKIIYPFHAYSLSISCQHNRRQDTNGYKIMSNEMKNISYIVPPIEEQKQIANFLDWKINEIDRLILTEKEKLKELEKYRQKYIDDTFRNIESNRFVSLSKMGNFIKGGGFSRENLTKSCNKAILYGDIYTKYNYWFEDCINTIDDKAFASARHIKGNVVLFTGSGETKEDIGKTVAYVGNSSIALGGDIVAYIPNEKFNAKYISYFCNSSNIKSFKYIESTGEIIVHITVGVIKNIKVPFINKEEQDIIVEKLDEFMRNYEKLVSIINDVIEKFSLLKQSLISEVVTGQIDVRNIVIPEYEKVNVIEDTKEMESEEDGS